MKVLISLLLLSFGTLCANAQVSAASQSGYNMRGIKYAFDRASLQPSGTAMTIAYMYVLSERPDLAGMKKRTPITRYENKGSVR